MTLRPHPYRPFIPEDPAQLILGSAPPPRFFHPTRLLPGDVDFYYGSRKNLLWPTIFRILNMEGLYGDSHEAVEQRKNILVKNKLAMADVFSAISRKNENASDSSICEWKYLDMAELLEANQQIHSLCFTSVFVSRHFHRYFREKGIQPRASSDEGTFEYPPGIGRRLILLPSPSPLAGRTGVTAAMRLEAYEKLFLR